MTKDVIVYVTGVQYMDGTEDETKSKGIGTYYEKDGKHYCFYETFNLHDKNLYKHTLKFDSVEFEMSERGNTGSKMHFNINQVGKMSYNTPGGVMSIDIDTKAYKYNLGEDSIDIHIDYELTFNDTLKSEHRLHVNIVSKE